MSIVIKTFSLLIACSLGLFACNQGNGVAGQDLSQSTLDQISQALQIRHRIVDNRASRHCEPDRPQCHQAELVLTTTATIDPGNWEIYFSHLGPIQSDQSPQFDIEHINGDLHRIKPTDGFSGIKPGQRLSIVFYAQNPHISEFDSLPNYYLVAPGLEPRIIQSTKTQLDAETGLERLPYVEAFTDVERQFKRSAKDNSRWATANALYQNNSDTYLDSSTISQAIIPTPKEQTLDPAKRKLDLTGGIKVETKNISHADLKPALTRLAKFGIVERSKGVKLTIHVVRQPKQIAGAYRLDVLPNAINITAFDAAGAAYGLYSLAGLITLGSTEIPVMQIEDAPRYTFRGMHLDVARNFHSKQLVLDLLDQMAAYKLNKLHLHLADDEGWRLQIAGLTELTDIGAYRCHDLTEDHCLLPQLGSGPHRETSVNGFYTAADYQAILLAAGARHIQVIPSLDMPSHARAAVKAMQARYYRLIASDETEAKLYLLSDLDDQSEYESIQYYKDNTINPCIASSYAFIEKVILEVKRLHAEAGHPLTHYHIGADETAGAWKASPACQRFFNDPANGVNDVQALSAYFIQRVSTMLTAHGIQPAGWSDGMDVAKRNMPDKVQVNAWGPLPWNGHYAAHKMANRGWDVVISIPDATYFDFPYEADPKERGYYWGARFVNTRKVFEFMPDNLPAHAEVWLNRQGRHFTLTDLPFVDSKTNLQHQPLAKGVGVIGLQGQLWSELLRADKQVEYMAFPRLLALAERAWHKADWELPYNHAGAEYSKNSGYFTAQRRHNRDLVWNRFANTLGLKELAKLDKFDIAYRIPTVASRINNNKLTAKSIFPGLPIQYRIGDGDWQNYTSSVVVNGNTIFVRALSADGKRKGRALMVTNGEHIENE